MTAKAYVSGTDLEQALAKAAAELGVDRDKLEYTVVKETKGLMGIGKTVKLEVWVKGAGQQSNGQEPVGSAGDRAAQVLVPLPGEKAVPVDGTVSIIKGQVQITSPQNGGKKALLIPSDLFQVKMNNRLVTFPVEVMENDLIIIDSVIVPAKQELKIAVAEDKMTAMAVLESSAQQRYEPEDHEPSSTLILTGVLCKELQPKLSREEILAKLAEVNVVYGIDEIAVNELVETGGSVTMVLARGMEGRPPEHETIEYLFNKKRLEIDEQSKMDHRERDPVLTVTAGEILAVKTPARMGEKGIDVTGKVWDPPLPKIIKLQAGPGVEITPDGLQWVAVHDGQPIISGGIIKVVPVYEVKKVDMDSGNIRFNGNVIVLNHVEENMLVEAKGNVAVYGSVNRATVRCGGDITIDKNVVASVLQAGGEAAVSQFILKYFLPLPPLLDEMEAKSVLARKALVKKGLGQNVTDGYLMKIMLENMFPQVGKQVEALVAYAGKKEIKLDQEVEDLILFLQKNLLGLGPTNMDFKRLKTTKQVIYHVIGKLQQLACVKANIKIGYLQNSIFEASGDIFIMGKGGYNSNITAGGDVFFLGTPGVFRGGTIVAGGNIKVGELGSSTGAATQVTVPKHAKIKAALIYPNVTIKVGGFSEKMQELHINFEAWISERGLETVKLKGG